MVKTMIDYKKYTEPQKIIISDLFEARNLLSNFTADENNIIAIENAAATIIKSLKSGGKIIACGNGGSMSDAMHFCSELTGRFKENRPPIPAIAISDPGHLSCVGNDFGYKDVFRRFIDAHAKKNDVIFAISTSGNSDNMVTAVAHAVWINVPVVFITGMTGGKICNSNILNTSDQVIYVNSDNTARIQEIHIKIIHILVRLIENGLGYVE